MIRVNPFHCKWTTLAWFGWFLFNLHRNFFSIFVLGTKYLSNVPFQKRGSSQVTFIVPDRFISRYIRAGYFADILERKISRVSRKSRGFQFDGEISVARSANVINIGGQVSLTMKTTVEDVQARLRSIRTTCYLKLQTEHRAPRFIEMWLRCLSDTKVQVSVEWKLEKFMNYLLQNLLLEIFMPSFSILPFHF